MTQTELITKYIELGLKTDDKWVFNNLGKWRY
jgi:hypothetical protein